MPLFTASPDNPYKMVETYPSGGPKTWQHRVTGERISHGQYRTRKKHGFNENEYNAPPLDASPDVEPPPPPPPRTDEQKREWQTFGTIGDNAAPGTISFWSLTGSGLYTVGRGVSRLVLTRLGYELAADYLPPGTIVRPVLKPLTRILDRHLPLRFAVQGTEDVKDVVELIAASEAMVDYWIKVQQAHEDLYADEEGEEGEEGEEETDEDGTTSTANSERRYGDTPRTGRSEPKGAGRRRGAKTQALDALATWRMAAGQDHGTRNGARRGESRRRDTAGDDASAGAAGNRHDGPSADNGTARQAASVRALLEADAVGRANLGL